MLRGILAALACVSALLSTPASACFLATGNTAPYCEHGLIVAIWDGVRRGGVLKVFFKIKPGKRNICTRDSAREIFMLVDMLPWTMKRCWAAAAGVPICPVNTISAASRFLNRMATSGSFMPAPRYRMRSPSFFTDM